MVVLVVVLGLVVGLDAVVVVKAFFGVDVVVGVFVVGDMSPVHLYKSCISLASISVMSKFR